ncbi:hypothetical protein A8F94_00025 [Bacillus sp. FJAT-27225]|uniref:cell wall elongation regulator TseB-like domain-containing protein n=1 Tax=Bacillus sp. FJAT-27225 TaxID=1743144 RepID=UPI00080C31C6|nr:DUF5590 domain-containing protein [Bacillus sp. FJAT-27225]OCA90331.1 hypothetical protein A8F94_00025 [Bacillus sp. FJAT-27225]
MKKIILFLLLFLLVAIGLSAWIYSNAIESVKAVEKKVVPLAKEKAGIERHSRFQLYNGFDKTTYVIEGKNNKGEEIIAWFPENSEKVTVRKISDGVSEKEAIRIVTEEMKPSEIHSIKLGMYKNIPIWEVSYSIGNDQLNYYLVNFDTGEYVTKILNL